MTENNVDSAKSVLADIEFTLSNYKPIFLDAIAKIRDSKKRPDPREMRLRISIKIQFKSVSLN